MMLHEGERLAYLRALGITQYVPQQAIPGTLQLPPLEGETAAPMVAEPVVDAQPEEAAPAAVVETVAALAQPAAVPTPPAIEPALPPVSPASDDIPRLDLSKLMVEDDRPRAAPPVKAAPGLRFSLAVVNLAQQQARLLVELAQPDAPGLSGVEFRLLGDLLLALGVPQELSEGSVRPFRWPPVNNARFATDVSAARDGLLGFLAAEQSRQPVNKLVFLGTAPAVCFAQPALGTPFALPEPEGVTGLFSHSLAALQQDWTLKPVLWQQLRAFL